MPFIRQVRDKRGYETTYVMHAYRPGPGPQRTRVLYLFRSPSHLKFGRRALDDEAREALEHTHPDVSFDWGSLDREFATARPEVPKYRERPQRPRRAGGGPPALAPPVPVPVFVDDDRSLLGRVLGAETAARLRARHSDAVQRITRRARTPEDRDRLLQAAQRLNPDDWSDETAVRTGAAGIDAQWEALLAEIPPRRRGRRGGRRRAEGEPSGIIEPHGGAESDEGPEDAQVAGDDRRSGVAGDDGDRFGPGPEPGTVPGDD